MLNKPVLVLGSKPGSQIPKINFNKVYTANGAAERGQNYKNIFFNSELICIVAMREFLKNNLVKEKILNSKPNRIIFRTVERDISNLFDKSCKIKHMSWNEQFKLQCENFNCSPFSIYLGELTRDKIIKDKILYFYKSLISRHFWGVSTGFFSILLAHKENPKSDIVVCGVGMTGGKQFYKSERSKKFDYYPRARVDRFLAKFLKGKIKNRIYSVDSDFVKNTKTKLLNYNNFI